MTNNNPAHPFLAVAVAQSVTPFGEDPQHRPVGANYQGITQMPRPPHAFVLIVKTVLYGQG